MKGILEYNLSEPDEKYAHDCAINAIYIQDRLLSLDNELRSLLRYGTDTINGSKVESLDNLAEEIRRYINSDLIIHD